MRKEDGEDLSGFIPEEINIAAIIACRLKSTRLPRKALLRIGELPSIELCIKNTLKFDHIKNTILATSYLDDDAELQKHLYSKDVIFFAGDPENVIKRYLDIIDKFKIDAFVRLTGDMPYVSNDILQILLRSHFATQADYTTARKAAIGTNLEIINSGVLREIKRFFPNPAYSEYMSYYFKNNPDYFKINYVDLPNELIRDYRLTLDYQEDQEMLSRIEDYFNKNKLEYKIKDLFNFLDNHPEITGINQNCLTKYLSDQSLIDALNKETKISKDRT